MFNHHNNTKNISEIDNFIYMFPNAFLPCLEAINMASFTLPDLNKPEWTSMKNNITDPESKKAACSEMQCTKCFKWRCSVTRHHL